MMKIFISWSGERSRKIAIALKTWLPDVFQGLEVFMSGRDIYAGIEWGGEIRRELKLSDFGILCLTPENLSKPWVLFEAGALSKSLENSRVVPYLFELTSADIEGPLVQFQGVEANEEGTFKLVESINAALEHRFTEDKIDKYFKTWWPNLNNDLGQVTGAQVESSPQRSDRALLEEILQLLRQQRRVSSASTSFRISDSELALMNVDNLNQYKEQLDGQLRNTVNVIDVISFKMEIARVEQELFRRQIQPSQS